MAIMENFLNEWRHEIGIALIGFFFILMAWSRKAAKQRSIDRKKFLQLSGFVLDKSREAEVTSRLAPLLPRWKTIDALTLLQARLIEMQSCHFTKVNGREICMARFCDQYTRPSGTTTDVEWPRTVFLLPCSKDWPAFALFYEGHAGYPIIFKKLAKAADAAAGVVNKGQLTLGIGEGLSFSKVQPKTAPLGVSEIYASDSEEIKEALQVIFALHGEIIKCGTLGIYCRDGYLALESIYYTPSNEAGPKYLVDAAAVWSCLQAMARAFKE